MTQYLLCTHAILHQFDNKNKGIPVSLLFDRAKAYGKVQGRHIGIPVMHKVLEDLIEDGSLVVSVSRALKITPLGRTTRKTAEKMLLS